MDLPAARPAGDTQEYRVPPALKPGPRVERSPLHGEERSSEGLRAVRQRHAERRVGGQVLKLPLEVAHAVGRGDGRQRQGAEDAERTSLLVDEGAAGVAGDARG